MLPDSNAAFVVTAVFSFFLGVLIGVSAYPMVLALLLGANLVRIATLRTHFMTPNRPPSRGAQVWLIACVMLPTGAATGALLL
jgi:hypothetical protein